MALEDKINELFELLREFQEEDRAMSERHHKELLDAINKGPDPEFKIVDRREGTGRTAHYRPLSEADEFYKHEVKQYRRVGLETK